MKDRGKRANDRTVKRPGEADIPPTTGVPVSDQVREKLREVDVGIDHIEGRPGNAGADTGDR